MMDSINWDMIGVILIIVGMQGGILLMAAKAIFITKSKIYDGKGITIFMAREECEKCRAEVKALTSSIVPREEWEKSKAYRERRMDENQRIVCGKIDQITKSVVDMRKEQAGTNKSLNNLIGSFETYLDLAKKKIK